MSETIGNAITDDKNTVKMVTADTLVVNGDSNGEGVLASGMASVPDNSVYSGTLIMLYKENGTLYAISIEYNNSSSKLSTEINKITLPTE